MSASMEMTYEQLAEGMDRACDALYGLPWQACEFMRDWLHANEDDFREFLKKDEPKETVDLHTLVEAGKRLISKHGENPEYDRGVVELIRELSSTDEEDAEAARYLIERILGVKKGTLSTVRRHERRSP